MTTTKGRGRDYGTRVEGWERRTAIPMLALAAVSIAILLAEFGIESNDALADSALPETLAAADLAIMGIFAAEFAYRISMVPRGLRIRYVLANPIDVLVVLVVGAQPLRLLRSARALRAFRAVRVAAMVGKGSKQSIAAVTRDRLVHGATIIIIATTIGAYAFAYFEGPAAADRFHDLPDAFWWSAATITSLGPGIDLEQTGSRVVALLLTVIGLSIVAALAGAISAFFVESDTPTDEHADLVRTEP